MVKDLLNGFFKRESLFVFIILLIAYGYFYNEPGYNGNSRLGLTVALVERHQLNLFTPDIEDTSSPLFTDDVAIYGQGYYTDKAIGSSILGAIAYWPIFWISKIFSISLSVDFKQHILTFLAVGLPSAINGSMIYCLCEYLTKSRFKSLVITLSISLGTMILPFSVVYFGHAQAATFLFISFISIFLLKSVDKLKSVNKFHLFFIGFFMGVAFQIEYTTAIVILPLILYYFYLIWNRNGLKKISNYLIPFIGGMIPLLIIAAYNLAVYDKIIVSGYQFLKDPYFREQMSKGIMGIGIPKLSVLFYETLHPAEGLFWLSPFLLMVFVGSWYMIRGKKYRLELLISLYACGAYLLLNAGYYMWWGGNSLGPRAIIPMLPFVCIPLSFVPKRWMPALVFLGAISIVQMVLASACQFLIPGNYIPTITTDPFFNYSDIFNNVLVQLSQGRFGWNIGLNWLGLQTWYSFIPFAAIEVFLILIFFLQGKAINTRKTVSHRFSNYSLRHDHL